MHRKTAQRVVLMVWLASVLLTSVVHAGPDAANRPLRDQLTPEEFAALGLTKLTPDELARLEAWIEHRGTAIRETTRTVTHTETLQRADQQARDQGARVFESPTERFITSRIAGVFRGFHGRGSLIELENGQVWRLVEDRRESADLDSPKVTLRRSVAGNHYLWVDGLSGTVSVVRVK